MLVLIFTCLSVLASACGGAAGSPETEVGLLLAKLSIKTGTAHNSGSDCDAYASLCGQNGCCQTGMLDNKGVNDRQKGHTDVYTGESVLGTCFLFDLGRPSSIEIRQDGHDAWFVEFASVELTDGTEHSCHYDHWFDEGAADTCVIWSQVQPTEGSAI